MEEKFTFIIPKKYFSLEWEMASTGLFYSESSGFWLPSWGPELINKQHENSILSVWQSKEQSIQV